MPATMLAALVHSDALRQLRGVLRDALRSRAQLVAENALLRQQLLLLRRQVSLQSLDEGWVVSERGSQRFPQNSVFKTWLAIAAIDSIERGEHRLDETLHVTRADLVYSHQPLADRVPPSGYDAKLGELLELMITLSDNPSTDLVMARLGGPEAVGKTLEKKGLLPLSPTRDERARRASSRRGSRPPRPDRHA